MKDSTLPTSDADSDSPQPVSDSPSPPVGVRDDSHEFPFLFSRLNYEKSIRSGLRHFKLGNMIDLCGELGNPQRDYPVLHIAGTKGKGSVAAMIGAVLKSSGIRTGIYSSPHLETVRQRIAIDGQMVSVARLNDLLNGLKEIVARFDRQAEAGERRPLTFFELITTSAFAHFSRQQVEAAVIEVGLGGRLDSTNICMPDVAVITNISLDHTRQLGDTVGEIAAEKAGIIKPGVPVVSGAVNPDAAGVIDRVAAQQNAPLYLLGRDFFVETEQADQTDARPGTFSTYGTVGGKEYRIDKLSTAMPGAHQITNAAVAVAAAMTLKSGSVQTFHRVTDRSIADGLAVASLPGRTEIFAARENRPAIVLDMAHNVASVAALVETLRQLPHWNGAARRRLLIAVSRDKDVRGILRLLASECDHLTITRYVTNPRCIAPEDVQKIAMEIRDQTNLTTEIEIITTPEAAFRAVIDQSSEQDFVCVTGSAFLVAELRPLIYGV